MKIVLTHLDNLNIILWLIEIRIKISLDTNVKAYSLSEIAL